MRAFTVAIVAALALLLSPVAASLTPATDRVGPFTSFSAFMKGDWDVKLSSTPVAGGVAPSFKDADLLTSYTFHSDNVTNNLFGSSFDNNTSTGDVSNVQALSIEFSDEAGNVGSFLSDGKALFNFAFANISTGVAFSQGKWLAGKDSTYSFTAFPENRFVLSVYPSGAEGAVHTFAGLRRVPTPTKTFFQSYGTILMMVAMMGVNFFVQSKTKNMANPPADGAAPAVAGNGAAAPAAPAAAKAGGKAKKAD